MEPYIKLKLNIGKVLNSIEDLHNEYLARIELLEKELRELEEKVAAHNTAHWGEPR